MTTNEEIIQQSEYQILAVENAVKGACFWKWNPLHPAKVTLSLTTPTGAIDWSFARQLLADGLESSEPVGEGDVHCCLVTPRSFQMMLESPEGAAILALPANHVVKFLMETLIAIPVESESYDEDIDNFLNLTFGVGFPDDTQELEKP